MFVGSRYLEIETAAVALLALLKASDMGNPEGGVMGTPWDGYRLRCLLS